MNLLIITDTWQPQINGVVRTLESTARHLQQNGITVHIEHPISSWRIWQMPFYPDIKLEFLAYRRLSRVFNKLNPKNVHIATEGTLGYSARSLCIKNNIPFTTALHTRFHDYAAAFAPKFIKHHVSRAFLAGMRRFHAAAKATLVPTIELYEELSAHGFTNLRIWPRGVDVDLFTPHSKKRDVFEKLPRPILLYVGRLALEKNLPAFCGLQTSGTKVVIGDGTERDNLQQKFPDVHFLGTKTGQELAEHYACADLFVFPSRSETFGLVLLEACASGLRVAALNNAPGAPRLLAAGDTKSFAVLDDNLQLAVDMGLMLEKNAAHPRAFAEEFSWKKCTDIFQNHVLINKIANN